jgi:hypothetical protein
MMNEDADIAGEQPRHGLAREANGEGRGRIYD